MNEEAIKDIERVQEYCTLLANMSGGGGFQTQHKVTEMAIEMATAAKINSTLLDINKTLLGVEYRLTKLSDITQKSSNKTDSP